MGMSLVFGAEAALTLTRDGQPGAVIVLAEKPAKAAQFAALELQWHVKAMTGATLPIEREGNPEAGASTTEERVRIYIGDTARARAVGLTQESFRIQESGCQSGEGEIILVGKDAAESPEVRFDPEKLGDAQANRNWPGFWEERGTLDAVYDFLHDACGVRWLSVTEAGTFLPPQPTLRVQPMRARRQLSFVYRDLLAATGDECQYGIGTALLGASSIWGHWTAGEKAEGHQAWEAQAYQSLHQQYPQSGDYLAAKRNFVKLFLLRQKNGGVINRCNHSMNEYFARFGKNGREGNRPEFFAQGYEGDEPPQLCYTSPELVKQQAKDAAEYYDRDITHVGWQPHLPNYFPIEPMDNGSFCKCPECQRLIAQGKDYGKVGCFSQGMNSDYVFHFVSAVQQELAKTHPDKHVITLAYASHAWPPRSVKLDPRVAVQFCFANNGYPANREEYDNDWRLLKAWAKEKKTSGRQLYVWLYPGMNRSGAVNGNYYCFPDYKVHTMAEQMKTFKRLGYEGMFYCGNYLEADAYASYRLMANADLDVDTLQDEYFTGLYGAAAAPLKKLHQDIEAVYGNPSLYPKEKGVPGSEVAWRYLGTAERMADYQELVDQAETLVATDREKRNLELFKLDIWKYMTQGRAKFVQRQSAPIQSATAAVVPEAHGDPAKVEWARATELPAGWYSVGGQTPIPRKLSGKLAHDGAYLYVELVDPCDPRKLAVSPHVAPYDDWELFAAKQRGLPGRQFLMGPSGLARALMHGEINWRMFDPLNDHGLRVASDTTASDKWV
ncbi:MAG: DUF4838 domain-containing protein, partial [Kiritimatiellae bacterium]|nr:DUF4838 domain-containing protein [Kiritimatiellia bacterium]